MSRITYFLRIKSSVRDVGVQFALCTHYAFGKGFFFNSIYSVNMIVLSLQGLFNSAFSFCVKYKSQTKGIIELSPQTLIVRLFYAWNEWNTERTHLFRFGYVEMELDQYVPLLVIC